MSDGFYRAFEERYRGPRALIKSRLHTYLPFVMPLAGLGSSAKAIDLGCGRGEWLELMSEIGFEPHGIDLDENMLNGCVELGLSVEKGDVIAFLAKLSSDSQSVVSAFHFVEHVSFEELRTVISEALRVLKPGGLLIMETPNPENILVATQNFYLDPTHERPIPPQLLSFIPEYYGFARTKTIRLQESKELLLSNSLTLHDVLDGVSPDYAVVAQKTAAPDTLCRLDAAFANEYGLNLATLADRYDAQMRTKVESVGTQALQATVKAERAEVHARLAEAKAERTEQFQVFQAEAKAERAEAQVQLARDRAERAEIQARQSQASAELAEMHAQHAKTRAENAEEQALKAEEQAQTLLQVAHAFSKSRSWRITAPLRWCGMQARLLKQHGIVPRTAALVRKVAKLFFRTRLVSPDTNRTWSNWAVRVTQRFGGSHSLRSICCTLLNISKLRKISYPTEPSQLTPRTREIYAQLKAAIQKKRN